MFRKFRRLGPAAILATAAISAAALAARPLANASYGDFKMTLQTQADRNINTAQLDCPAVTLKKAKWVVHPGVINTGKPIRVDRKGNFRFDGPVTVNTPSGSTLLRKSRVVFTGQFVSSKEAKGTYHLFKDGCKTYKFDAKRQ